MKFSVQTLPVWAKVAALGIILTVGTVVGLLVLSVRPVNPGNPELVLVRVEEGDSVSSVVAQLKEKELIRSTFVVRLLASAKGTTVQPGLYHLSQADSPLGILSTIAAGTVSEQQVTILEGWRLEEIAVRLVEAEVLASPDEFMQAAVVTDDQPSWLRDEYGLAAGDSLEGFLFPDTYRFSVASEPTEVIAKLLATFRTRTEDLPLTYDGVILASIVEREALFDDERASIAGVYENRLSVGMKLDADPTVQYAKATNAATSCWPSCETLEWWPTITTTDYTSVTSPYNTYTVAGLPPTPIANPGLMSLRAAAAPTDHAFFYFLHDAEGRTHFGRNLEEHTRNKRQFLR